MSTDRPCARRAEATGQAGIAVRQLAACGLLVGARRRGHLSLRLLVPAKVVQLVRFVARRHDAIRRGDLASLRVMQRRRQR